MAVVARKWEFCAAEISFCKFYYTPCPAFKFEEVKKSTLQRLPGTDAKDGQGSGLFRAMNVLAFSQDNEM